MTAAATTDTIEALERQAQHLRAAADEAQRVASLLRAQLTAPAHSTVPAASPTTTRAFDVEEAADFLGMSVAWVYKAAGSGELPSTKIGARRTFDPEKLLEYRAARASKPAKLAPRAHNGGGR